MTVIAGYVTDEVAVIGSDSGFVMGLLKANPREEKLIELNDSLGDPRPTVVGIAGDAVARQYICGQSAEPPPLRSANDLPAWTEGWIEFFRGRELVDEEGASGSLMLVLTPEEPGGPYGLFLIDGHGTITYINPEALPYFAIGSGALVAFGALYASMDIRPEDAVALALKAAVQHADGCSAPIDVRMFPRHRGEGPFNPELDEAADRARAALDEVED